MTEKQIEKIRLSIKKHRATLAAEKTKFGEYFDNRGRRYYISDLYIQIPDYKGAITYKKWFDKNFPDDIGSPLMSLHWSIAYYELDKIAEAKIYTIDTAFQNIYIHKLLLNREVHRIEMQETGIDMLEFAESMIEDFGKAATKSYLNWLSDFIETEEYTAPINKFIALNKLLKHEKDLHKRSDVYIQISDLKNANKNI